MIGSFHTRLKLSIHGKVLGKNVNDKFLCGTIFDRVDCKD